MDYSHGGGSIRKWVIVLIVVGIIVLGLGYFFFFSANGGYRYTPEPEHTTNQAADLKTYTNSDYGFEIQYPTHLRLAETNPKRITLNNDSVNIDIQIDESTEDSQGHKITLESYTDWLTNIGKNATVKNTTLGGIDAREITQDEGMESGSGITNSTIIVARKNNKTYFLRVLNFGYNGIRYNTEDFYKIVSTFKFTGDQEPAFSWLGSYQFEEFAPPNQGWMYALDIRDSNGAVKVYADLAIDGFQTLTRIHATTSGIKDYVSPMDIIFDSYNYNKDEVNPIVNHNYYKKGDILFTLTPALDGKLTIQWKKMDPELKSNLTGAIFKKVSN